MSSYFFVICEPGREQWVKRDVARRDPTSRFAFSRPGFMTFRCETAERAVESSPTVFAKAWGLCLGRVDSEEAALAQLAGLPQAPQHVHAFVREDDESADESALTARLERLAPQLAINRPSRPGDWVFDLVQVDPNVLWTGLHRHTLHRPTVGGRPPLVPVPAEAPSRVWSKVEEALWWSGMSVQPDDLVLDIGCAPGGGTWNLLQRGVRVLGVDPAEMAPAVAVHPRFAHRRVAFEHLQLTPDEKSAVRWLFFDVNLSPMLTLKHLANLMRTLPFLEGALLTLKLNRIEHVDKLDWMLERIRSAQLEIVNVTQLTHNRQEVCVYARRLNPLGRPERPTRLRSGG